MSLGEPPIFVIFSNYYLCFCNHRSHTLALISVYYCMLFWIMFLSAQYLGIPKVSLLSLNLRYVMGSRFDQLQEYQQVPGKTQNH